MAPMHIVWMDGDTVGGLTAKCHAGLMVRGLNQAVVDVATTSDSRQLETLLMMVLYERDTEWQLDIVKGN